MSTKDFIITPAQIARELDRTDGIYGRVIAHRICARPASWARSGSRKRWLTNEVIVHCTATPEGENFNAAQIRNMHLARGFKDVGYHYIVGLDGTIYEGRPFYVAGAHCYGHNMRSVGIAYVGGIDRDDLKPRDTRTLQQKVSLSLLLYWLHAKYPGAKLYGHCELSHKACPCFDVHKDYDDLFQQSGYTLV